MRIMYLLFSFTVGGTEKLIIDICNEMSRQGHTVFLYIVNGHYDKEMLNAVGEGVIIKLQNRTPSEENVIHTVKKIALYVKENKIEVIHCNSLDSPELTIGAKLFCRKVKIIYTIHGIGQWNTLGKMRSVFRNLICHKIIAISKSVRQDIIEAGARAEKVHVVYNAINRSKFCPKKLSYTKGKEFVIGNVARLRPDIKGQDILIRAVAKVREKYSDVKCLFAGGVSGDHQQELSELEKLIYDLGLQDHIEFMGNISDIPLFLSKLDLFVLPSRSEGFGISLIEAMAENIPCIASELNGPGEIIGEQERGLLFPVEDIEALADKIIYAIEFYNEMENMSRRAVTYVAENFDIQSMCVQLVKLYK